MAEERNSTFITRIVIENYKSIKFCDVQLGPLMLLVGPNGSGKSNFLDALRFVTDALNHSLDHALRERGGIREVCHRSGSRQLSFKITVFFEMPVEKFRIPIHPGNIDKRDGRPSVIMADGLSGFYTFTMQTHLRKGFIVRHEECNVQASSSRHSDTRNFYYRVDNGKHTSNVPMLAPVFQDRLYLVNAAGFASFRPVYDYLSRMAFYNLNPDRIRNLQPADIGELLLRDGSNIASVLAQMNSRYKADKQRIEEYLARVAPPITGVSARTVGNMETLEFRQQANGAKSAWTFPAANMSDGTLRALGVLVALFQSGGSHRVPVPLIGIEEPEVALHPAATGVLLNSLCESSRHKQILITSHSPELLDSKDITADAILAVVSEGGNTQIGPLNAAGRFALRDHLYTAGELLRLDQLAPEITPPTDVKRLATAGKD